MEMFEIPFSILAFLITLWITSFFATLMGAKKADTVWVLMAWSVSLLLSIVVLVGLNFIGLDQTITLVLTYFIPFVIFTFVYKVLNKMNWAAAITTNITVISVGVIAMVMVIISVGKPLDKTIISLASDAGLLLDNTSIITVAEEEEEYEEEVLLTDQDLLSEKVIAALERQKKKREQAYNAPKFQLVSVQRANGAIGYRVRLLRNNGHVLEGLLSTIENEEFIVKQTLQGGVATIPIAISSVKKLEVYR